MLRLTIISILLSSLVLSQNEEIKIAKVEVDGNEVTSKKTIIFTSGLREGQTITTADFKMFKFTLMKKQKKDFP